MLRARNIALVLLLLAKPASAMEQHDPCSAASSASDVRFTLALRGHGATFQEGEIIPLVLSFTSGTKNRYWADVRNYDRSGRLDIEYYCVDPEAPDPLASYFKAGVFLGGGLGSERVLDATPFTADAELNEWRALGPGRYRVYAISQRIWRLPDARDQTPYGRVSEAVRSNTIEIDVNPPDPAWQSEQLRSAMQTLAGSPSPEDARHAARTIRFLNTKDSTRQLARLFWGINQQQPIGWDLMFGLDGSPYRQLAIDSMHAELTVPDHAITNEFLGALVNLQVGGDPLWDPHFTDPARANEAQAFWDRRRAHTRELMETEIQTVVAALSRKTGSARAVTLNGLLTAGGEEQAVAQAIRPALIAAWTDLPRATQQDLIQYRWTLIAGPEMLPILRRIVAEPPLPSGGPDMMRDTALKHLYELDPAAGREAILRDLENVKAQPSLEIVKLLSKEDLASALGPAVERIGNRSARGLDYELVDRYADGSALGVAQAAFEEHVGKWACALQSAMLRYFLRVAPAYGAQEVSASLSARKDTGCYKYQLQNLGAEFSKVQRSAIDALDDPDPDLVQDAVLALGRWGSSDAETPLWGRLRRFHEEWAGREDQLRSTPDYQSPGSRGAALEQWLVFAIAKGTNWICPPDKLARLAELVWTKSQKQQIEGWMEQWKQGSALISPRWFPEDAPAFAVLQYDTLTEDQLRAKVAQFPSGMQLRWQFWQPGQISPPVSMAKQEAFYERIRAEAERHGVILEKANHP
jgi:hypothetical protein